ncbi:restriction endonuclease subunit S [Pectobacterium parmentieri]|nr:restriction endonuclease subunit S [Pectobacterium parmentieri]PWD68059.1 restriction endonuclease subunit S [Pectobacterium parmentieri]
MSVDNKVPEIRFKGFSGEWVYKKLQDLADKGFSNGVFNDPQKVGKGYRLINVKDMYTGDSINIDNLSLVDIDEKEFKNNKVEYGDIFFTRSSLVREGIAYSNVNLSVRNDITFDGHLIRMQPCKATTDPVFLAYLFKTSSARKQFILGGKTTTMTTIGQSDIAVVELAQPDKPEQTQIGSYFRKLDALINQHQEKHDKLSNIKKSMLERMFPKQGETIPEIRFKGFSGEWDEKVLNNEVELFSGLTYSPSDIKKSGTLVLRSSNVKNGQLIEADNIYVNPEVVNCSNVVEGDIIVVVRNGSRSLIGKHAQVTSRMNNTVIGAFMTGIRSKQPAFINALLDTNMFTSEVEKNLGATINQITNGSFKSMVFMFPTEDEQQEIGNYFQKLDNLINQHQQQITKLNNIKQACLSKMFV